MAIQKIKLDLGTVYQKEEGGIYYFRYQVNGARKAISLKTRNQKEALKEANKQIPLLKVSCSDINETVLREKTGDTFLWFMKLTVNRIQHDIQFCQ